MKVAHKEDVRYDGDKIIAKIPLLVPEVLL
jgi:hypothetical protein